MDAQRRQLFFVLMAIIEMELFLFIIIWIFTNFCNVNAQLRVCLFFFFYILLLYKIWRHQIRDRQLNSIYFLAAHAEKIKQNSSFTCFFFLI